MRWFGTFLSPSAGPESEGEADANPPSRSTTTPKAEPSADGPPFRLNGEAPLGAEDTHSSQSQGEWDDALGRWKWRSKVWRKRWDTAPIPEQYEDKDQHRTASQKTRSDSRCTFGVASGHPRTGATANDDDDDDGHDHDEGGRSNIGAGAMFFTRRLGSSSSTSGVSGSAERHQDKDKVQNGGADGHRAASRSRNLAVLETMLRSSYRAGFNDALKLSPFMLPGLPPSPSTLPGTATQADKKSSSAVLASNSDDVRHTLSSSTPIAYLILPLAAVLGTGAVVAYHISSNARKMRDVERGLKEVLALVQLRERAEVASLGKIGNELRAVREIIASTQMEGRTAVSSAATKKSAPDSVPANSDSDSGGSGGTAKAPTEALNDVPGTQATRPEATIKSEASAAHASPPLPPSSAAIPPPTDARVVSRLNQINQQLAIIVSQSVKQKQFTSDLVDTVSAVENKVGGMVSDVGDIKEKIKVIAASFVLSGTGTGTGTGASGKKGSAATSNHDPWSKWYQTQEADDPTSAVSTSERANAHLTASSHAPSLGAPASSTVGLGMKSKLPSLASHSSDEIMPLHDIRKAIDGVKKGYLADQEGENVAKKSIDLSKHTPAYTNDASSSSAPVPTQAPPEANTQLPPKPEMTESPSAPAPTPTPVEGKHLVHSSPRDHLLIQPYPPHDRAEDIKRAAAHSTDIARVRYPARADRLDESQAKQHETEDGNAQRTEPVLGVTEPQVAQSRMRLPATPCPSQRPTQKSSQNIASAQSAIPPKEVSSLPKASPRSQQANAEPTPTPNPSSTYTETPTGHWWTFHHTSPSNAWKIRGFGWYDSVSPRDGDVSASAGIKKNSDTDRMANSKATGTVSSSSSPSDAPSLANTGTGGQQKEKAKRQQRPKQEQEADQSVAGWAIERARKRWGDWPFY
ncbi:hypothetical protein IAU59_004403 [Kwoniella sp. CBS 9459]